MWYAFNDREVWRLFYLRRNTMIDFSNCLENLPPTSEYKKFRIHIDGYYYWGDGYKTRKDYEDFEKVKWEKTLLKIISRISLYINLKNVWLEL